MRVSRSGSVKSAVTDTAQAPVWVRVGAATEGSAFAMVTVAVSEPAARRPSVTVSLTVAEPLSVQVTVAVVSDVSLASVQAPGVTLSESIDQATVGAGEAGPSESV